MVVRPDQVEALRKASVESFRSRMRQHLTALFPVICGSLTPAELDNAIDHGIRQAGAQGFHTESTVCRYIDLMFLLGSGFDTDKQLPWAAELLAGSQGNSERERMDRLYGRAMKYLDSVAGPRNEYIRAAVERFATSLQGLARPSSFEQALREAYPEKAEAVGECGLTALIEEGAGKARSYGLSSPEAARLIGALMFALGGSFDVDPKLPWAAQCLQGQTGIDELSALKNLYGSAMGFLAAYRKETSSLA